MPSTLLNGGEDGNTVLAQMVGFKFRVSSWPPWASRECLGASVSMSEKWERKRAVHHLRGGDGFTVGCLRQNSSVGTLYVHFVVCPSYLNTDGKQYQPPETST